MLNAVLTRGNGVNLEGIGAAEVSVTEEFAEGLEEGSGVPAQSAALTPVQEEAEEDGEESELGGVAVASASDMLTGAEELGSGGLSDEFERSSNEDGREVNSPLPFAPAPTPSISQVELSESGDAGGSEGLANQVVAALTVMNPAQGNESESEVGEDEGGEQQSQLKGDASAMSGASVYAGEVTRDMDDIFKDESNLEVSSDGDELPMGITSGRGGSFMDAGISVDDSRESLPAGILDVVGDGVDLSGLERGVNGAQALASAEPGGISGSEDDADEEEGVASEVDDQDANDSNAVLGRIIGRISPIGYGDGDGLSEVITNIEDADLNEEGDESQVKAALTAGESFSSQGDGSNKPSLKGVDALEGSEREVAASAPAGETNAVITPVRNATTTVTVTFSTGTTGEYGTPPQGLNGDSIYDPVGGDNAQHDILNEDAEEGAVDGDDDSRHDLSMEEIEKAGEDIPEEGDASFAVDADTSMMSEDGLDVNGWDKARLTTTYIASVAASALAQREASEGEGKEEGGTDLDESDITMTEEEEVSAVVGMSSLPTGPSLAGILSSVYNTGAATLQGVGDMMSRFCGRGDSSIHEGSSVYIAAAAGEGDADATPYSSEAVVYAGSFTEPNSDASGAAIGFDGDDGLGSLIGSSSSGLH